MLPNFIVIGMDKAGTSFLYRCLKEHPDIFLPRKEIQFFGRFWDKGLSWYEDFYGQASGYKAVGDITPGYWRSKGLPRIKEVMGDRVKLIFLVRNPMDVDFSWYVQSLGIGKLLDSSFAEAAPLNFAKVPKALNYLRNNFDERQVLIINYDEDLRPDPKVGLSKILSFLGLSSELPQGLIQSSGQSANSGKMPRYLYSPDRPIEVFGQNSNFIVPRNTLVLCTERFGEEVIFNPSPDLVAQAFGRQSRWTQTLPIQSRKRLYQKVYKPIVSQIKKKHGIYSPRWEQHESKPAYRLADPPRPFRQRFWSGKPGPDASKDPAYQKMILENLRAKWMAED
ncbi:MAG: sulfotransferase [Pseudomonadota bacterium]